MQDSKSLHYALGVTLALIAVFVVTALVMINSQATDTNISVTISNVGPTVESLVVSNDAETGNGAQLIDDYGGGGGTIDSLIAGSYKELFFNGIVEDTNGAADITGVSVVFRRSLADGADSCTADKNDCYKDASCDTYAGPTTDQLYYSCGPIGLDYFADSTALGGAATADHWVARVTVTDGTSDNTMEVTKEVQTLLALSIPSTIDYGTLPLGQSTSNVNNVEMAIQQQGNDEADVEVSSTSAMSCSVRGAIPVANQQWALTDIAYSAEGTTSLSGTAGDTNLNVAYQTNDVVIPSQTLYWNILIPTSSVEGTCTGVTIITAIAH